MELGLIPTSHRIHSHLRKCIPGCRGIAYTYWCANVIIVVTLSRLPLLPCAVRDTVRRRFAFAVLYPPHI